MPAPTGSHLDKSHRKSRARGGKLSPRAAKLVQAALDRPVDEYSHEECLAALPTYVDAEIEGALLVQRFPEVKRHLDTCESCATQYAELLEVMLADQGNRRFFPASISEPNLDFFALPAPEFVKQKAAEILAEIAPEHRAELTLISELFFERIKALDGHFVLDARASQALGFGTGKPGEALTVLAAVYAATNKLVNAFTGQELDTLAAQDLLCTRIEAIAHSAAFEIRLDAATAKKFAQLFAQRTCRDLAVLHALIQPR